MRPARVPARGAIDFPSVPSRRRTLWSNEAEAIRVPSGPHATDPMVLPRPGMTATRSGPAASHSRILLSG